MTPEKFNEWRVFPRLGMVFMSYMLYAFHIWFTNDSTLLVTDLDEWSLIGYGTVVAGYVGLWKFYFETGNKGIGTE
jgi:hypothetical protein